MSAAKSETDRRRHASQWVLVDTRFQLLSVGESLYHGVSPRGVLDVTARHVLIPRMREALWHGQRYCDHAEYGGTRWAIQIIPIQGPVVGKPLAVLGCYGSDQGSLPAPPVVGAWEWRVMPPGPHQQMRTFWSASLFDVYGIPRPTDPGEGYWEAPQWIDELILDADRPEILRLLQEFLETTTDGLFLHIYRVRSPVTGQAHRLRFAGRSDVTEPGPPWWFRGVSVRVDDVPVELPSSRTDDFVTAAFRLSADPMCAIDTSYEHLCMTSRSFGQLGIALPAHRHLPEMVHPDDMDELRTLLKEAVTTPEEEAGPIRVRFVAEDRSHWQVLELVGAGIHLDQHDPHHVLCRVTRTTR